jgi:REP element-mobilizing transposase RayT
MGCVGRRQHVHICAYAIMPDHLHVVLCACEGGDMAKWLAYLKREVTRRLGVQRLWERSFWDHHAANDDKVTSMVECTLANPVHYRTDTGWLDSPYTWSEWHPETRGRNPNLPEWAG